MIDDGLTFHSHIDTLSKKISRSVGVIYKMSHYVPSKTLLNLYNALVNSNLSYGVTCWGGSSSAHIRRLCSLQRRVVNILPQIHGKCNFSTYDILKFDDLFKYACCSKFFKCFILGQHDYFSININSLLPTHGYQTRHRTDGHLNLPFFRKSRTQRSFYYNSAKCWNELPPALTSIRSLGKFKTEYKKLLVNNYVVPS